MPLRLTPVIVVGAVLCGAIAPAQADLTICNQTHEPAGIALAMKVGAQWTSSGWWTVKAGRCKAVLEGALGEGPYFIHGAHYNVGGRWEGDEKFCIARGSFSIKGRGDCKGRGYQPAKFLKVETNGKSDWQHTLAGHSQGNTESDGK
jgi:uncharacterized membrane protein